MSRSYRGSGSASYHPALLLGILVYGYATGVFSSRKLERATYDSVAFRFIAANEHPDHDTIAAFRRRFLKEIEGLFVQVLALAREMGVLKLGTVALDGTKIHANASRHSALSYEHAGKIEAQLKAEVAELLAQGRGGGSGRCSRRHVDPRRTGAPRGASGEARRGPRQDRGARQGALRARAGRASGQAGGAGRQGRGHGQEAQGQAAPAAGRRSAANRSDQSDGRAIAHHAGGGRRVRAVLQRPGGGGGGQPAGGRRRRGPGAQRQAAARADAGARSPPCPRTWASRRRCWRTPATSARPTWRPARRPGSSR